jgi:hypothetical protein
MWKAPAGTARRRNVAKTIGFAWAIALLLLPAHLLAADVAKVEEDWELVLNGPSPAITAPQVTCTMTPLGHLNGVYAALEINHGTLPDFTPGGLQLQVWSGEEWLTVRDYADSALNVDDDTVRWTQRMSLGAGKLTFQVVNGSSTTWGAFATSGNFKLSLLSLLTNLNSYSPDLSVNNSGIGFGSQRVASLTLKRVRYYDSSGNLLSEDTTPRVVHD